MVVCFFNAPLAEIINSVMMLPKTGTATDIIPKIILVSVDTPFALIKRIIVSDSSSK